MTSGAWKIVLLGTVVAALWLAETLAPQFAAFVRSTRNRRIHAASIAFAADHRLGFLRVANLPLWIETILALFLFDC